MTISVSIITPTANRPHFLSEAIATVRAQTMTDWELIIVDDASTDGTSAFLRGLRDPRISWLRCDERRGPAAASNAGLERARGKYVMFLDDDDLLRPDALELLTGALDAQPHAISAAAACRLFHDDGDSVRPYRPARAHTRVMWREFLFGWWSNSGQNLHRTALVRELGGFDPAVDRVQDRKLWLQLARRGPICVVPNVAMEYRQHPTQLTKSAGIAPVREAVWQDFIRQLPRSLQGAARRVRLAAQLVEQSRRARLEGHFARSLWLQTRAGMMAPALVLSPFLGRPFWWGIKKSLLRSSAS